MAGKGQKMGAQAPSYGGVAQATGMGQMGGPPGAQYQAKMATNPGMAPPRMNRQGIMDRYNSATPEQQAAALENHPRFQQMMSGGRPPMGGQIQQPMQNRMRQPGPPLNAEMMAQAAALRGG